MKLISFVGACAVAALALPADAASGKGKPGYCNDDTQCAKTYTCVSVQTTRDGVENVKQCLPTAAGSPVCTGTQPGLCPSFSTTWGTNFRQIASVCAFILPEGKGKCLPGNGPTDVSTSAPATTEPPTSSSSDGSGVSGTVTAANTTTRFLADMAGSTDANSTKGGLECLFIKNPANETDSYGVIYGCVDFDGKRLLFDTTSKSSKLASQFNYSQIVTDNCVNPKNPQGSTFVCSSQGTCSPNSAASMDYACKCNIGFSGKYCEKILNNKCYNDGVCGGGSCNLATNECTNCTLGTTGNKCALCDPTYDATKVCNAHGKCVTSSGDSTLGATNSSRFLADATYQCKCDDGWGDIHCGVKIKTSSNSATSAPAPAPSMSAARVTASITAVALVVAAVFSA